MEPKRGVRRRTVGCVLVLLGLVAIGAAGCSSAATPPPSALIVADAWARPAPVGGDTAAYLTITNPGTADVLLSVQCTIAGSTMLHETSTDASGMTGMSMLDTLPVPAGATVRLEPGGAHLMIGGLTRALVEGEHLELRLVFEHAGEIVIPATIRPH